MQLHQNEFLYTPDRSQRDQSIDNQSNHAFEDPLAEAIRNIELRYQRDMHEHYQGSLKFPAYPEQESKYSRSFNASVNQSAMKPKKKLVSPHSKQLNRSHKKKTLPTTFEDHSSSSFEVKNDAIKYSNQQNKHRSRVPDFLETHSSFKKANMGLHPFTESAFGSPAQPQKSLKQEADEVVHSKPSQLLGMIPHPDSVFDLASIERQQSKQMKEKHPAMLYRWNPVQ